MRKRLRPELAQFEEPSHPHQHQATENEAALTVRGGIAGATPCGVILPRRSASVCAERFSGKLPLFLAVLDAATGSFQPNRHRRPWSSPAPSPALPIARGSKATRSKLAVWT